VTNILAIAGKELRSYFASPIAYVVIGCFAFLFGFFFSSILGYFLEASLQMGQFGPQSVDVNQQLIRPLVLNATVVFLLVLPGITMRTYAEEKRSGTMELLLTSPVTDLQIILGKFLGAMALYAVMLAVTLPHFAVLFVYGAPDWRPIASAYLGLLLFGGCFISVGLFISSLTKNQIVAFIATFAVFLLLWVIDWLGRLLGPTGEEVLRYMSLTGHLDDFVKGVIDTKHVVYYLSVIALGLFLTARSVDSERWRG
jgi:ABC-2 type transport system permease protein